MDSEEFVTQLQKAVGQASVKGVLKNLDQPPGRRPRAELLEMSQWFRALNSAERQMVQRILEEVARHAVFGFLAVLDGVRKIDDDNGQFLLRYVGPHGEAVLNDPSGPPLHELL